MRPTNQPPVPGDGGTARDARLKLIWNERRKLEATFINNLGVAVMVTGAVTPLLANLYGVNSAPSLSWLTNGWVVIISLLTGLALNGVAAYWLNGLE